MTTDARLGRLAVSFLITCGALACATAKPAATPPRLPAVRIVILTSQGVPPEKDTVGFNAFVRNISGAFSHELESALAPLGKETRTVLEQDPALDASQVLSRSVTYGDTDAVITLGLENQVAPSGKPAVAVVARFMPLSYSEHGARRAVIPRDGTSWTFPLTKPDGGWRDEPVSDLVRPFVEALKARGEI